MNERKAIKVQCGKVYDIRHRRIVGHYARLGEVSEQAATENEAIARLQVRLESLPNVAGNLLKIRSIARHTLIMVPDASGTSTYLVCPDGHVIQQATPSTDTGEIESDARNHVAQLLWPDPAAFDVVQGWPRESDFRSWSAWQKRYSAARASGMSDVDAHQAASACYETL